MSTLALDCVCGHIKARSVQCTSLSSVEIYSSVLYIATLVDGSMNIRVAQ